VTVLALVVAGALGAPLRLVVERAASTRWAGAFPIGTFLVNVTGSLALGVVVGLTASGTFDADTRTIVGTGFLGAYTTFSTYAYEAVRTNEGGCRLVAAAYALGSIVAGGAAAAVGLALTGAL
jgi:CrcB protein